MMVKRHNDDDHKHVSNNKHTHSARKHSVVLILFIFNQLFHRGIGYVS